MRLLAVLALLLLPLAGHTETGLRPLVTGDDGRGWEAVGRIDIAGTSFCTGSLIAPDLVLTAAHCLFDRRTGARHQPESIEFLAGWRNGRATAYRNVRRAVIHPAYRFDSARGVERASHDLALLELDQPIRNSSVTPFATHARPIDGAEVGVVSYAHDRAETPALQEVCHVLAHQSGALVTSCTVDFGSSGAPIFTMVDGVPQIVSVVSAKAAAGDREVALGTDLDAPLADLRAELARGDGVFGTPEPVVRRMSMDDRREGSGAKFLRP